MTLTSSCGVTWSSILRSWASEGSLFGSSCWPIWRSACTWRSSRSVLVKISPFTFTRTCSTTSPAAAAESASAERTSARAAPTRNRIGMAKFFENNILHLLEQLAQQPADPFEEPSGRPWIFFRGAKDLRLRESGLHFTLAGAGGPPARGGGLRPRAAAQGRTAARRAQG